MSNAKRPAFPFVWRDPQDDCDVSENGLTKRELFAAMAMQGVLASMDATADTENDVALAAAVALVARLNADALIAELDKPRECLDVPDPLERTP